MQCVQSMHKAKTQRSPGCIISQVVKRGLDQIYCAMKGKSVSGTYKLHAPRHRGRLNLYNLKATPKFLEAG
jgi:hypothetical protein